MTVGRPAGASGGAWSLQVRREAEGEESSLRPGKERLRKLFDVALETDGRGVSLRGVGLKLAAFRAPGLNRLSLTSGSSQNFAEGVFA